MATPSGKASEPAKKAPIPKKRSRTTIASLSRDLIAVQKERDAATLQPEAARRTLAEIARLAAPNAESTSSGLAQAAKLASDAAQSVDVSALLAEMRSMAR